MNMKYLEPADFGEASALLSEYGDDSKVIAGGTALVLMLRQKFLSPAVLVSLGQIRAQRGIHLDGDGLHLGALASLREVEQSLLVRQYCPALAHTYAVVGNIRIRHQATVGGNLAEA